MRHIATLETRQHSPDTDQQPQPEAAGQARFETQPGNDDAVAASVDLMAIHPVWGSVGSYSKAPAQETS